MYDMNTVAVFPSNCQTNLKQTFEMLQKGLKEMQIRFGVSKLGYAKRSSSEVCILSYIAQGCNRVEGVVVHTPETKLCCCFPSKMSVVFLFMDKTKEAF